MFFVDKNNLSFSYMCKNDSQVDIEYSMIFMKDQNLNNTIAHEMMHLFGAPDLYVVKEIK